MNLTRFNAIQDKWHEVGTSSLMHDWTTVQIHRSNANLLLPIDRQQTFPDYYEAEKAQFIIFNNRPRSPDRFTMPEEFEADVIHIGKHITDEESIEEREDR